MKRKQLCYGFELGSPILFLTTITTTWRIPFYIYIYIYIWYICVCVCVCYQHDNTLTKRLEKKLDRNYTRMLRAVLNKSWRQHPTRHQLYGHLPPITKTIQVRRTRHAGHCWRSKDDQFELTYSNYVTLKTCRRRWMIGKSGERGQHDIMMMMIYMFVFCSPFSLYIYIYIY